MATRLNHNKVVGLLLSSPGIQINAKDNFGKTALHYACAYGSLASLSKLLAAPQPLELNESDGNGETPIMLAIRSGNAEAVRMLAAVPKVDLDVKDNLGRSLEEFANRWVRK